MWKQLKDGIMTNNESIDAKIITQENACLLAQMGKGSLLVVQLDDEQELAEQDWDSIEIAFIRTPENQSITGAASCGCKSVFIK